MMTDPVGDMLARIRNAGMARHNQTRCPASKLKGEVARVMREEGFLSDVKLEGDKTHPVLVITLRYGDSGRMIIDGLRRLSRPSRRVYVAATEVPKVRNGMGIAVISTSKGVMCDRDARAAQVGGELLCEVW